MLASAIGNFGRIEGFQTESKYHYVLLSIFRDLNANFYHFTDKEQVWVDCHGEYPADIEALGEPEYFPRSRGFPGTFFPYLNNDDYVSPIVAVRFPNAKRNQLLHVECRVWAKNIAPFYSKRDRIGLNHFELMILDGAAAQEIANGGGQD